jgi:hypothetical protein
VLYSWYNEANHSDFTLGLSDGTKIHAHKIILCSNNKRFERICGDMTSHAVSISTTAHLAVTRLTDKSRPEACVYHTPLRIR